MSYADCGFALFILAKTLIIVTIWRVFEMSDLTLFLDALSRNVKTLGKNRNTLAL